MRKAKAKVLIIWRNIFSGLEPIGAPNPLLMVVSNIAVALVLNWIILNVKEITINLPVFNIRLSGDAFFPSCVSRVASTFGLSVILVTVTHVLWRFRRRKPLLAAINMGIKPTPDLAAAGQSLPSKVLDWLHPWMLSDHALNILAFGLFLIVVVFGFSSFSPFPIEEFPPIIDGFLVRYGGEMFDLKPGRVFEVNEGSPVTIEAKFSKSTQVICAWSTRDRNLPSDTNCSTLYYLPFGKGGEALRVDVKSACMTTSTYGNLFFVRKQ